MEQVQKSAASVEEAIEAALAELGVSEQQAKIEILQEPRTGFLRLNTQDAVVRVTASTASEDRTEAVPEEQVEAGIEFLEGLFARMGIEAEVSFNDSGQPPYLDVWALGSEGLGLLIGRHGHTVDALQELVSRVVHQRTGQRCAFVLDVEDYRKRRRTELARRAEAAARKVSKTGREEIFEPMSPHDRKVVHETVAPIPGVTTASSGLEPNRQVVIRRA